MILRILPSIRDKNVAIHFAGREFECNTLGDDAVTFIESDLLRRLDVIRECAGVPIKINSGYRTPSHNARVGGATNSRHLYGMAADISSKSIAPISLAGLAHAAGFRRVGVAKTFVHVDVDQPTGEFDFWTYAGVAATWDQVTINSRQWMPKIPAAWERILAHPLYKTVYA